MRQHFTTGHPSKLPTILTLVGLFLLLTGYVHANNFADNDRFDSSLASDVKETPTEVSLLRPGTTVSRQLQKGSVDTGSPCFACETQESHRSYARKPIGKPFYYTFLFRYNLF